jgi:hypothetical protein
VVRDCSTRRADGGCCAPAAAADRSSFTNQVPAPSREHRGRHANRGLGATIV